MRRLIPVALVLLGMVLTLTFLAGGAILWEDGRRTGEENVMDWVRRGVVFSDGTVYGCQVVGHEKKIQTVQRFPAQ